MEHRLIEEEAGPAYPGVLWESSALWLGLQRVGGMTSVRGSLRRLHRESSMALNHSSREGLAADRGALDPTCTWPAATKDSDQPNQQPSQHPSQPPSGPFFRYRRSRRQAEMPVPQGAPGLSGCRSCHSETSSRYTADGLYLLWS